MIGLCDNCALKYADCKGNKDKEKCRCDYYKKPVVMNVKELAERVAELEIENERLRRITEAQTATDTFINDGECYLDGGDDIDDGMAYMPLPEPYKDGDTK